MSRVPFAVPSAGMTWTEDQAEAVGLVERSVNHTGGIFVLSGFAGTGKSTLVTQTAQGLLTAGIEFQILCPTGKAAARLRSSGVLASTMHSWLYTPAEKFEGRLYWYRKRQELPERFVTIIDESSMVDYDLAADLLEVLRLESHKDRVCIFVGDTFQLPPVEDTKFSALKVADLVEFYSDPTEVHIEKIELATVCRQAQESPILVAATALRDKEIPPPPKGVLQVHLEGMDVVLEKIQRDAPLLGTEKVYITWTNADRHALNEAAREALGFHEDFEEGELLMVQANNRQAGLSNGDQVRLVSSPRRSRIHPGTRRRIYELTLLLPDGEILFWPGFLVDKGDQDAHEDALQIGKDYKKHKLGKWPPLVLDYGYCITCHKAQGSEYDDVTIYAPDRVLGPGNGDRWLYTALTRAKHSACLHTGPALAQMLGL